jgi:general nucleoside transport system permease protein
MRALKEALLPAAAVLAALLLFGLFVWFAGVNPWQVWVLLFKGAFGDWYSWQNTL